MLGYICLACVITVAYGGAGYGEISADDTTITGFIAGDNVLDVYVDERWIGSTEDIIEAGTFVMPRNTRVIALRCVDFGGLGGFIGSFSDGLVTDGQWKCSPTANEGWMKPGFDDRHWQNATTYTHSEPKPFNVYPAAEWIWTDKYKPIKGQKQDQVAYCRRVRY